jgi:hypothetical protein
MLSMISIVISNILNIYMMKNIQDKIEEKTYVILHSITGKRETKCSDELTSFCSKEFEICCLGNLTMDEIFVGMDELNYTK